MGDCRRRRGQRLETVLEILLRVVVHDHDRKSWSGGHCAYCQETGVRRQKAGVRRQIARYNIHTDSYLLPPEFCPSPYLLPPVSCLLRNSLDMAERLFGCALPRVACEHPMGLRELLAAGGGGAQEPAECRGGCLNVAAR